MVVLSLRVFFKYANLKAKILGKASTSLGISVLLNIKKLNAPCLISGFIAVGLSATKVFLNSEKILSLLNFVSKYEYLIAAEKVFSSISNPN